MLTTSPEFKADAHRALADAGLQRALAFSRLRVVLIEDDPAARAA